LLYNMPLGRSKKIRREWNWMNTSASGLCQWY